MAEKTAEIPFHTTVRRMIESNTATPDLFNMCSNFSVVPLFVFGTEKYRYSDHGWLSGNPRYATAYTIRREFEVYQTNAGDAVALFNPKGEEAGAVHGEIYLVSPEVITDMDHHQDHGIFTMRLRPTFRYKPYDDRKAEWKVTSAYWYLGRSAAWLSTRDGVLKKLKPFVPSDAPENRYYSFTPEYDLKRKAY